VWEKKKLQGERSHGEKKGKYIRRKNEQTEKVTRVHTWKYGITVKSLVDFLFIQNGGV